ncbi:hypothetical protein C7460_11137 [Marinoscillum furvescens DSM 4134]|uniref:Uncharacterized protein n=1 Tax=Marinoscillum furvescens DSM 4134 TaxID=1122208 RepID=A0A3D9L1G0_MARFU|nr:hypothetical protein C7460_11137 [Marinoscillum furvescens DSM 4134]
MFRQSGPLLNIFNNQPISSTNFRWTGLTHTFKNGILWKETIRNEL